MKSFSKHVGSEHPIVLFKWMDIERLPETVKNLTDTEASSLLEAAREAYLFRRAHNLTDHSTPNYGLVRDANGTRKLVAYDLQLRKPKDKGKGMRLQRDSSSSASSMRG